MDAYEYITTAVASFDNDPADTDFQRGYLAAFETVLREASFEREVPVLRTVH